MDQVTIRVHGSFDKVVAYVTEALREQGFGVLTKIDVRETLRERLGVQMERYLILGTCHPALARRALDIDRSVGLLLPCNVVVREHGSQIIVEAVEPGGLMAVTGQSDLEAVATEASRRLTAALHAVAAGARRPVI